MILSSPGTNAAIESKPTHEHYEARKSSLCECIADCRSASGPCIFGVALTLKVVTVLMPPINGMGLPLAMLFYFCLRGIIDYMRCVPLEGGQTA